MLNSPSEGGAGVSLSPTRVPLVAVRERGLRESWQESRGWRVRHAVIQEPPGSPLPPE